MKHEPEITWYREPDESMAHGYWQAHCSDCGWTGHRYTSLAGADEDGLHHTRREFYEMGRRAFERGEPNEPIFNRDLVNAISDLSAADPRVVECVTQFQRGWTDTDLFTPL